jgi:DNA ligase 1
MLQRALSTLRLVAETPSRSEKITLLKANDSPCLRDLCLYTYDRYKTYGIKRVTLPKSFAHETDAMVMRDFKNLLDRMAAHRIGIHAKRHQIDALLSRCTTQDAWMLANVIQRDLRAGIDAKTVNAAFPELVPVFKIQQAYPLDSWDRVPFPVIVEEKIDGIRCIAIYDGEGTRFFSRNGIEFETGMDAFAEEISWLLPGVPYMFDAELRAHRFNPDDPVCQKHKDGNWRFEYTKAISNRKQLDPKEVRDYFTLYIFDALDLEFFVSAGKWGPKLPLEDRKTELLSMFARHNLQFKSIELLPNYLMGSREEVLAYMLELKAQQKEGCMLKLLGKQYGFSRTYNVLKLKHFAEGDFRILDAFEGEAGKKYEGMLGGLVIGTDDGKIASRMGTGISDTDRVELWVEHLAGRLVGQIVEVQFKDITADGSLQLPSLSRFREDKDTTDTWEMLMAKLMGQGESK